MIVYIILFAWFCFEIRDCSFGLWNFSKQQPMISRQNHNNTLSHDVINIIIMICVVVAEPDKFLKIVIPP